MALGLILVMLVPVTGASSPLPSINIELRLDGTPAPGATVTVHAILTARDRPGDTTLVNWTVGAGMTPHRSLHQSVALRQGTDTDVPLAVTLQARGQQVVEVYAQSHVTGGSVGGYRRAFIDVDNGTFYLDSDSPPAKASPGATVVAEVGPVAVAAALVPRRT